MKVSAGCPPYPGAPFPFLGFALLRFPPHHTTPRAVLYQRWCAASRLRAAFVPLATAGVLVPVGMGRRGLPPAMRILLSLVVSVFVSVPTGAIYATSDVSSLSMRFVIG